MSRLSKKLLEYSEVSSIHCLKYLSKRRISRSERIFWAVSLLIAIVMFCFLVYKTTSKFMSDKIIIELSKREHSIEEVPFPAFTICPEIFTWPDNFTFALSDGNDGVLRFVEELQRSFNYNGDAVIDLLNQTLQYEWLYWIVDGEWPNGWSLPFQTVLTQWGFCFSFNLMPLHELLHLDRIALDFDPELLFTYSYYSTTTSLLNKSIPYSLSSTSLQLVIGLNVNFPQYFFDVQTKPGYHFIIHSTNEFPSVMSSHFYHFIHETAVLFTPEATLVPDGLSFERRNCYFNHEKPLNLFKVYTKKNCEHECQSFLFSKRCRCVPFYFLRTSNTAICGAEDLTCVEDIETKLNVEVTKCNCLDRCEAVSYRATISQHGSQRSVIFASFKSKFFQPFVKVYSINLSDFLSNMGGILGLIAGASVLSIVELFFHLLSCGSAAQQTQNRVHPSPKKTFFAVKKFAQSLSYFIEFSKITDVDGMRYTNDKNQNLCSKVFWILAIIVSSITCFAIIVDSYNHAEKSPVAIRIDQKIWTIDDIDFPAVTICPDMDAIQYILYRDCFFDGVCDEISLDEVWKAIEPGSLLCNFQRYREIYDNFHGDARLVSNLTLSDRLNHFNWLEWMQKQSFCYEQQPSAFLSPTVAYSGLCYTFNSGKDVLDRKLHHSSASSDFLSPEAIQMNCTGKVLSKKNLKIDAWAIRDRYFCTVHYFKVYIHGTESIPSLMHVTMAGSRSLHQVLTPKIYTADESLRSMSPKQRNCYFHDERKLKFFSKYTKESCIIECRSNASMAVCGCVFYYDIREESYELCNYYADFECYEKVDGAYRDEDSEIFKECDCLPSCNSIEYNSKSYFENLQDLDENITRSSYSLYFGAEEFVAYQRYATFGIVSLLSNVGGLLGLFLGVSVLSIVEIFYFFVIRLLNNLCLVESSN